MCSPHHVFGYRDSSPTFVSFVRVQIVGLHMFHDLLMDRRFGAVVWPLPRFEFYQVFLGPKVHESSGQHPELFTLFHFCLVWVRTTPQSSHDYAIFLSWTGVQHAVLPS